MKDAMIDRPPSLTCPFVAPRFSWYFGAMSRQDSTDLLMAEREGGVFLVRDSATIQGDYVLCVRQVEKERSVKLRRMAWRNLGLGS